MPLLLWVVYPFAFWAGCVEIMNQEAVRGVESAAD
jgi:hypothetical protein